MNEVVNTQPELNTAMDLVANKRRGFKAFNGMGWAMVIFMAGMLVLPTVVIMLLAALAPNALQNTFFGMPLTYICMYLIGFPLMLLVVRKIPNTQRVLTPESKTKLSPLMLLALYPLCFGLMNLIATGVALVEQWMGASGTTTTADIVGTGTPVWITFVIGVIIAPVMEEIVFRGIVYKKLSGFGAGVFIAWTAVIFGLFHMNFGQSLYAGALGAMFSVVMYKTGSLLYTIILHVLVNFTGGIGIGSIIIQSGSELAMSVYSIYVIVLMVLAVIIGIVLLVRKSLTFKTVPTENTLVKKSVAFLNPGTIVYIAVCLVVIVAMFFV